MIKRKKLKVGRNQKPCICGKNVKYKYCCGGNNNHIVLPTTQHKNNNGNGFNPHFINTNPKKIIPIITNDIEEDFKMMTDEISGELGDFYWNLFRSKKNIETCLIGEVGIVRFGFYQSRKDVKPHICLGAIEIREKDRGKGIGKKWVNSIINITKSYNYGLVLKPMCLDYDEGHYNVNKLSLDRLVPRIENPIDKMRLHNHLIESISRYENTPSKQRVKLHYENTNRLWDYYTNLGFIPFHPPYMIYDKELKNEK